MRVQDKMEMAVLDLAKLKKIKTIELVSETAKRILAGEDQSEILRDLQKRILENKIVVVKRSLCGKCETFFEKFGEKFPFIDFEVVYERIVEIVNSEGKKSVQFPIVFVDGKIFADGNDLWKAENYFQTDEAIKFSEGD